MKVPLLNDLKPVPRAAKAASSTGYRANICLPPCSSLWLPWAVPGRLCAEESIFDKEARTAASSLPEQGPL